MDDETFATIVRTTIENLPEEFRSQLDNVSITIEDWPTPEVMQGRLVHPHQLLLGLYQGVPKTKRQHYASLPDKITIFKQPILRISENEEQAKRKIRETVLHEIGHHFGLSDQELEKITITLEKKFPLG